MPRSAKTVRSRSGARAVKRAPGGRQAKSARLYHHGALREALLQAAERLLERDGVQGLTLRAAAREAGVSHAAPKHHFGDLSGLLTDLAIVGFERFRGYLATGLQDDLSPREKLDAIGRGYVAFAKAHPGLFLMMFRSERLDMSRPALRAAARASQDVLASALGESGAGGGRLTLEAAGRLARAWSLVHGFSILLIDGRWKPLLARLPEGSTAEDLLEAAIDSASARRSGGQAAPI
ncbi:MAG TPA: TetR/AcrR family transcriptional regulator [Roseiarcus sp.]|nr:TetR/AcrR family transcriptional regulator [Roseiarcus sp.]